MTKKKTATSPKPLEVETPFATATIHPPATNPVPPRLSIGTVQLTRMVDHSLTRRYNVPPWMIGPAEELSTTGNRYTRVIIVSGGVKLDQIDVKETVDEIDDLRSRGLADFNAVVVTAAGHGVASPGDLLKKISHVAVMAAMGSVENAIKSEMTTIKATVAELVEESIKAMAAKAS